MVARTAVGTHAVRARRHMSNERILVVEDDPEFAEVLQYNLTAAGYEVVVAHDGLEALRSFDAQRPSLITIDLNVPTVSGFRLVELFKRNAPDIPVVVITASAFEEAEEVIRSRVDDFLTKPFDPEVLVHLVDGRLCVGR